MRNIELSMAIRRFKSGDALTDNDLKIMQKYYDDLDKALSTCYTREYKLFHDDVIRNLRDINGFIQARKEKATRIL